MKHDQIYRYIIYVEIKYIFILFIIQLMRICSKHRRLHQKEYDGKDLLVFYLIFIHKPNLDLIHWLNLSNDKISLTHRSTMPALTTFRNLETLPGFWLISPTCPSPRLPGSTWRPPREDSRQGKQPKLKLPVVSALTSPFTLSHFGSTRTD